MKEHAMAVVQKETKDYEIKLNIFITLKKT